MALNPQSYSSPISPRAMYSYDRGLNKSWNMSEYKTPRIYQDPAMQVQKRKWQVQEKGQKTNKYVTKRGFYMDYHIKVSKSIPSPTAHGSQEPWSFKKQQAKSKFSVRDPKLIKNTFLEQIQREQDKRKKPGVCTYNLEKSIKQKEQDVLKMKQKVVKQGEKRYFYQNTQDLSGSVPGTGNYNPHDSVPKLKADKTDHKFWIGKHKKQSDFLNKREKEKPTSNTYAPLYQSFTTFDKIDKTPAKQLQRRNGFGSDAKFEYVRPDKKAIKQLRPSPDSYNTKMNWRGKKYAQKGKQWHQALWKGSMSESIYR